jgi:two-component system response regulator TtrR
MPNNFRNMKILIVDDDELVLSSIELMFKTAGFNSILKCSDSRLVAEILDGEKSVACMILDLSMPYKNGNDVLSDTVLLHPETPVVMLTSTIDIGSAVHCIKEGAVDYLTN